MIEAIDEKNLSDVIPIIRKYQEFYKVENIDNSKNLEFFSQFGEFSDKGCLFDYRKNGKLVAFATVYFTYASSIISKVGVLNDLFTSKGYRNQGIATELIKHCEIFSRKKGAARLQWVTSPTNMVIRNQQAD